MKFKRILTAVFFALVVNYCASAIAGSNWSVVTGYFEGGALPGRLEYNDSVDGARLLINYYSPSLKRKLTYSVAKFDNCSVMAVYKIPVTSQMVIDGSCSSQGGQIYEYVYEWSDERKNWCLIREVTGEKADVSLGAIVSSEHVSRVKNCPIIGEVGPYSYKSRVEVVRDIYSELSEFKKSASSEKRLAQYLGSLPAYSIFELADYVDSGNVRDVNDLAFHLSRGGRAYDAIPLLERIVSSFPGRVVAKLNLADAYWDSEYKAQAVALYKEYCDEMSSLGLQGKIPGRVFDRKDYRQSR